MRNPISFTFLKTFSTYSSNLPIETKNGNNFSLVAIHFLLHQSTHWNVPPGAPWKTIGTRHSVLTPPIYPLKRFCQQINRCRRFHSVLTPLIYPLKPHCTALLDRRSLFIQFLLHQPTNWNMTFRAFSNASSAFSSYSTNLFIETPGRVLHIKNLAHSVLTP